MTRPRRDRNGSRSTSTRVAVVVGIVLAVAGFSLLVFRGLGASLSTGRAVLFVIGALAFVQGVRVVIDRYRTGVAVSRPAEVESVRSLPRPGREFRDAYDRLLRYSTFERQAMESEFRADLESLAVDVLCQAEGCSTERARELLSTGEWTDDEVAAAFFDDAVRRRTAVGWLRAFAGRDDRFERRVDRVVGELAALLHHEERIGADEEVVEA